MSPQTSSAISRTRRTFALLLFSHDIAFLSGGEAALGREAKLIERHIFRRFFNTSFDGVLVFEFRELAGDETKHNGLVLNEAGGSNEPERSLSYSRKNPSTLQCEKRISATGS